MKKILYILLPIFVCSISTAQSALKYEVVNGDTINVIDENNLKQGFWRIFGKMKKLPGYEPDQVVEEGNYENSRKQGLWKNFFPSGKVKSEIAYVNSRPNGTYKTYFENGQVEEEGNWENNRNTGGFKRYHENGKTAQEFVFNESGKRDGKQVYFYENGQVMIEADIVAGKEKFVKEYYEDGSVKAEKSFIDGELDVANTKVYEPKTPNKNKEAEELAKAPVKIVKADKNDEVNSGSFNGNGQHTMYNKDKQLSKVGFFENYRLMDGLLYKYDNNGILYAIEKYKAGRHIGNAPLPKE
ncbi:MAG: toxin-antitoxin system YwqK family antitoxin [Flavobacteriales bacterium]|nr:toxin-antitoxin system YwqK family antitoxin [Flavobacteriales bacterium]